VSQLDEIIPWKKMDRIKLTIKKANVSEVADFFTNNESKYFRYFLNREFDVILRHVYTALYYHADTAIGYGHIDFEDRNWLGVFINKDYRGKNLSRFLINDLLNNCSGDVYLTVDLENTIGFKTYCRAGFKEIYKTDKHYLMVFTK